jgi:hypothetical protein
VDCWQVLCVFTAYSCVAEQDEPVCIRCKIVGGSLFKLSATIYTKSPKTTDESKDTYSSTNCQDVNVYIQYEASKDYQVFA